MAREYKKVVRAEKKKGLSIRQQRKKTSELVFKGVNDGTQSEGKRLSHNQKLRKKIREVKNAEMLAAKLAKQAKKKPQPLPTSDGELDSDSECEDTESTHIEMEEDSKPKKVVQFNSHDDVEEQSDNFSEEEDSEESEEEDDMEVADDNKKVYTFDSDEEDDDVDEHNILEESEDSDDEEKSDDEGASDSSSWSDAERECDEEERAEKKGEEEKEAIEDYNDGLPSLHAVQQEIKTAPNLEHSIKRIDRVIEILNDFRNQAAPNRKRKEYMDILCADLCLRYSYNSFLIEELSELFSIKDLIKFLEANESDRPVTIRTNTIKTQRKELSRALANRGVTGEALRWSKVGMVIYQANVAVGATLEYMAGHYMLQGASSLLPVMALAPKMNELVMDMCAAPGGKATHIASMMKNTGTLFANDANKKRIKSLAANLHRLGVHNAVVSCMDGRNIAKKLRGSLDRVLLDAPCTGTGIISKDQRVKSSKSARDIQTCSHLQYDLLLAAIDSVNAHSETGGYVVYSTCSVLVEENERVVNKVLEKRDVKLVPTGLEIGASGLCNYKQHRFHPSMKLMKRIYPHEKNMEGFCVAKLKVLSNYKPKKSLQDETKTKKTVDVPVVEEAVTETTKTKETKISGAEKSIAKSSHDKNHQKKNGVDLLDKPKKTKKKVYVPAADETNTETSPVKTKKTKKLAAGKSITTSALDKNHEKDNGVDLVVKSKKTKNKINVPAPKETIPQPSPVKTKKTKKLVAEKLIPKSVLDKNHIKTNGVDLENKSKKTKSKVYVPAAKETVPQPSPVKTKKLVDEKSIHKSGNEETVLESSQNGQVEGSKNKKRKREQLKTGNNKRVK